MRKVIFLLMFASISICASAQTAEQWQQIYGGNGVETGFAVRSCLDQGYIVVGATSSLGPSDGYIVRTDSLGLVMWSQYYGGSNVDVLRSVELLSDSGFIVAGYTNSFGSGGYDGWILRLDKNGDTLWTLSYGTPNWDFFFDVAVTYDSGFVFAGGTYGLGMGDEDMLFLKLDSAGNVLWYRTYGGMKQDEARSICELPDSSLATCGFTFSLADTLGDSWILDIDEINGDTIWSTTAHFDNQADKAYGIANSSPFGIIYFCGNRETSPGNDDPYFNFWGYDGDSVLSSTFGGADDEYFYDIVTRPEGTVALVGTNYTVGAGAGDMMMFHTEDWNSYTYGTQSLEQGYGIDVAHDRGYIMCGSTEGYGSFQSNVYLVKTDSMGAYTSALSIREPVVAIGSTTVFPNPASAFIAITYDAPNVVSSQLKIEIVDMTGRSVLITQKNWNQLGANTAQTNLDISQLSNGMYFYRITDNNVASSMGSFSVAH